MTTLLLYQHHIYTDSIMFKGDERFESLTKVQPLSTPLVLASGASRYLPKGMETDTIHGWVVTGVPAVAKEIINALTGDTSMNSALNTCLLMFEGANMLGLGNHLNTVEILLIGEKHPYSLFFADGESGFKVYDWNKPVTAGSGGQIVANAIRDDKASPIAAMYKAYQDDPHHTGGLMDIWEMQCKSKAKLHRIGICQPLSKDEMRHVIDNLTEEYVPDFIQRRAMIPMAIQAMMKPLPTVKGKAPRKRAARST